MASLQEQLLKAGIVDKQKAKQVELEKRKQTKQSHKGHTQVNETKELAKKALAEKTVRDREINRQHEAAAELKAIAAQIRQLIEVNRIDRQGGETAYQFTDGTKIKKIYVSPLLHNQLSKGLIAVVRLNDQYELVPAVVADKISQRDESIVLVQNQANKDDSGEDDYYADFKIPDDLMW
ncbi:MAG: DUF2058 domain-containing protein [Porticoccus sp.]|nr:DUF2058 domain-containing protein [Porticoccus sp.]